MSNPEIIYEDRYIFVVCKPSGWITNDASTTGSQPVLQSWLAKNFDYETAKDSKYRSGIVHRLDKETSGVIIIARTKEAFESLQKQFKERIVKKVYMALVHGKVEPEDGSVEVPVGRLPWRRDRFGVLAGGRSAITEYRLESLLKQKSLVGKEVVSYYSLLSVFPKTGRTHQIRIHMKYIGHPLVSDSFYAGRKTARVDRKWCPRLFLHASSISFMHPHTHKTMSLESSVPEDLQLALSSLQPS